MREAFGRLEARLIDLYGKLGYDYHQDQPAGKPKAGRRGRLA